MPADAKDAARRATEAWLATGRPAVVRINGAGTECHEADVAMVGRYRCAVMVPKSVSACQLEGIADRLQPATPLVALVETAAGVLAASELCGAASVVRAAFGSVDLGAELGIDPGDQAAFATARSLLILASAAGGLPAPLDGVTTAVNDDSCLASDLANAARLGFGGKLCVHPRQVAPVNDAFTPSEEDLVWARRVTEAAAGRGACIVDGRMVDKPVVERAARLLARSSTYRPRNGSGGA